MIAREVLEEFERLSVEERIQLVQDLWDRIAAKPEEHPPLTTAQREELERRLAAHAADPDRTVPAQQVFDRLQRPATPDAPG